MTFILLANGREFQLAPAHNPAPPPIEVIAHSLSQINRFAGHSRRPYSVAEHSLLVADIAAQRFGVSPVVQLACLMHDAHECITGDVASPVKQALGAAWSEFEAVQARAVRAAYKLRTVFGVSAALICQCDLIALATERRDLMPFAPDRNAPWPVIDTEGSKIAPFGAIDLTESVLEPMEWKHAFLDEFRALKSQVDADLRTLMAGSAGPAA